MYGEPEPPQFEHLPEWETSFHRQVSRARKWTWAYLDSIQVILFLCLHFSLLVLHLCTFLSLLFMFLYFYTEKAVCIQTAFSAFILLVGHQEEHMARKY